jgi:ABC-type dipeptide transport system, periplasmic component
LIAEVERNTDQDAHFALYADTQRRIAEDHVNGFLFQHARTSVASADREGLWENDPTQAQDMTDLR